MPAGEFSCSPPAFTSSLPFPFTEQKFQLPSTWCQLQPLSSPTLPTLVHPSVCLSQTTPCLAVSACLRGVCLSPCHYTLNLPALSTAPSPLCIPTNPNWSERLGFAPCFSAGDPSTRNPLHRLDPTVSYLNRASSFRSSLCSGGLGVAEDGGGTLQWRGDGGPDP